MLARFLTALVALSVLGTTIGSSLAADGPKKKPNGKQTQQKKGDANAQKPAAKKGQGQAKGKDAAKPAPKKKPAGPPLENPVGRNFKDLDKDKNGFLSIEEIFGRLPQRGSPQRDSFEAADRDGNDWMNAQEFILLQRILVAGPRKVLPQKGGKKPAAKKPAAKKPGAKKPPAKKAPRKKGRKARGKKRR